MSAAVHGTTRFDRFATCVNGGNVPQKGMKKPEKTPEKGEVYPQVYPGEILRIWSDRKSLF